MMQSKHADQFPKWAGSFENHEVGLLDKKAISSLEEGIMGYRKQLVTKHGTLQRISVMLSV